MKQILLSAHIVIMVLLLSACGGGGKASSVQEGGDTLKMKYATNLSVVKFPDYTMVSIRNPWDTLKTLHTYLLTDKTRPVPENLHRRACAFGAGGGVFGGTWKCAERAGLRREYQGCLQPGIFQDAGNTGRMPEGYGGGLWKQYESGYRENH